MQWMERAVGKCRRVQVNSACQFVVDLNGVQGKLVAPSGSETDANLQQIQQGTFVD